MASFPSRLLFTLVHCTAHVCIYWVQQMCFNIFFRWPITLLEWLIGVESYTLSSRAERHITTLGSRRDRSAYDAFGLTDDMFYESPLYGGHVQTLLGAFRPNSWTEYKRETITARDGNPLCVDFLPPKCKSGDDVHGMVVMMPGLTSHSQTTYVRRIAEHLSRHGYYVAVCNSRGVGNTPLTSPQLYSAVYTDDIRQILNSCFTPELVRKRVATEFDGAAATSKKDNHNQRAGKTYPVIGLSVCLGGIVASKYVGEEGAAGHNKSPLDALITLVMAPDLNDADYILQRPMQTLLYRKPLFSGLQRYVRRHWDTVRQLPGVDTARVFGGLNPLFHKFRSVRDLDSYVVAPHFGFSSVESYYSSGNSFNSLRTAPMPVLCISAKDDPICGPPPLLRRWEALVEHNPHVAYVELPAGGHVGFLGSPWSEWSQEPNSAEQLVLHSMNCFCNSKRKSYEANDAKRVS